MDLDNASIGSCPQGSEKKGEPYVKVEPSGVRRKLFQEDGTDGNEAYQDFVTMNICEQGSQVCQRNWNQDFRTDVKRDNKMFDKERKDVSILIISTCKDLALIKMVDTQAKIALSSSCICEVSHCFPESAYRLASIKTITLIILDLNCDFVENLLKISLSIRTSAVSNSSTPIIAIKHNDPLKDDVLRKYGVSEIIYGPLYQATIGQLCQKYLNPEIQRELSEEENKNSLTAPCSTRPDEFKVPSLPTSQKFTNDCIDSATPKNGWSANRNDSPIQACDSTDQITPYCESDNAGTTVQIQVESGSAFENEKNPTSQGTFSSYSVNCLMPLGSTTIARQVPVDSVVNNNGAVTQIDSNGTKGNSTGWNFIQQILDLHQNVQKDMDQKSKQIVQPLESNTAAATAVSKPLVTQPSATVYPSVAQYSTIMKNYTGPSLLQAPAMPQNASYMVSGTPDAGNLKISLIPDEYAKHSSKERERRERIKESCDELRKILPKQLMMGRRQDMATVLEMTVHYLRIVQDHLPAVIQHQLYQNFMTYAESKQRRKRKSSEVTQQVPCMIQNKLQRLSNAAAMPSSSSNGCHLGSFGSPNYLPQLMQSSNQQQANSGYFSPIYHPLMTNPYHTTVNASPVQPVYGSGTLPSLDHVMHLRSQYYSENQPSQNNIPCYVAVTSASRDTGNSNMQRQDPSKASFIN